jgi:hypothetical protein
MMCIDVTSDLSAKVTVKRVHLGYRDAFATYNGVASEREVQWRTSSCSLTWHELYEATHLDMQARKSLATRKRHAYACVSACVSGGRVVVYHNIDSITLQHHTAHHQRQQRTHELTLTWSRRGKPLTMIAFFDLAFLAREWLTPNLMVYIWNS